MAALDISGSPMDLERKLLNDSLIYLQARRISAAVLTRNRRDFDLLNQVAPAGSVIFYA